MTTARTGCGLTLETRRRIRFQQHPELTACWIWTGPIDSRGRARGRIDGHGTTARAVVYRQLRGEPTGQLHARCQQELCVNPNHMETKENA